jgi:ubiquinone/menaquinone biosynthesis C-methylase UbiE
MRRHRLFALVYDVIARSGQGWEEAYRRELCRDARGLVLELGVGTGLNLLHYGAVDRVVGVEPEPIMLRRAVRRATAAPVPISLLRARAERLPFPGASFDTVVCSLMLCSVEGLEAAVTECRRVLRPGGTVRFYEHVRSEIERVGRLQDAIERPWGFVAGGCHPNRDTTRVLADLGFELDVRRFDPPVRGGGLLPHVIGAATLPAGAGEHRTSGP